MQLPKNLKTVGIVGIPPLEIITELNANGVVIHDLDAMLVKADMESTVTLLPRVYCAVLRTVVLNAMHIKFDAVIIDTGPGKCDAAYHVATVLSEELKVPVIRTVNTDNKDFGYHQCLAKRDLQARMIDITDGVKLAAPTTDTPPACPPTAGFWGVPPRDFGILTLFPDTTHIYGWSRCMENKTPANHDLEAYINPDIPTVFFSQSFCAKTALARLLAKKHPHGLYLDVDVSTSSSAKAKIQAFLELSGVQR